jgi:hypothetical protein
VTLVIATNDDVLMQLVPRSDFRRLSLAISTAIALTPVALRETKLTISRP